MDGYNAHDASVSTQQELFESGSLSPSAPNIKKISDRHLGPIGKKQATPFSKRQIESFIDFFHINMNEFEPSDIDGYATFEDFFVRAHKPGSRPIHAKNDATKAVVMYDTVAESIKIWIKGTDFIITNLVMDRQLGPLFDDRAVASFRLSPQDYHRYHSPISGKAKLFRSLPGDYYQVDPMALRSDLDILSRNTRDYVVIESEEFGDVLFVAIGATDVGSVLYMSFTSPRHFFYLMI
jgi:phosphatidylserine decarboxylase precursor